MEKATRFVLYARKSSEREDRQVQSIDDQITYWQRKALEEGIEIVKIYTEEKSAKAP
jgi:predicted site-specific integrase-resolvase